MSDCGNAKVRKKRSKVLESSDSDSSIGRPVRRKKQRRVLSDESSSSDGSQSPVVRPRPRRANLPVVDSSSHESASDSDSSYSHDDDESSEGSSGSSGSSMWQSDWLSQSDDEDWVSRLQSSAPAVATVATHQNKSKAAAPAPRLPSSDSEDSDGQSDKCPICLRSFTKQEIGTPESCDHSFCFECLQEWAKNVNTCPVDRQMFTLILVRKRLSGKVVRQIPVEERQLQVDVDEPEEDPTYCEICGCNDREDRLLLCDGCDLGYHLECLDPPLHQVPIEQWFCPECIAANNTSRPAEDTLGEEILQLLEDLDEHEVRRQPRTRPEPRLMPRTRQNVRVSGRLRSRQLQLQTEQPSTSSGLDSQDVERVSRRCTVRAPPRRTKVTRRRRRRKKRRTVTRKTKKVTIVNSDGEEEELEVPCTSKPRKRGKKRRKRRKTTKKKVVVRRRVRTARVVAPLSTRNRIAEHLRMLAPQRPGQTIPDVRPQRAPAAALGTLGFQRSRAGIPTLHLFGQRNQLDYFSGSDQEDGGGVEGEGGVRVVSRARSSVLRHISRKVATMSPVTQCDLVSSILDSQSVWHSKRAHVTIKQDGSLVVKGKVAHTDDKKLDVKDPAHRDKVTSRAPMYSGRGGSGDSRPPPESAGRYGGPTFHGYQGGRGYSSASGFDARGSRAGYSSFLGGPQLPPPPSVMGFRGGPVRFRVSPPRFPARTLRPPPLPPRLLHQQIAPTTMEAFDADDETRPRGDRDEDEEIDLYSDIEPAGSLQADDEAEKSYEALPPPPIPPALLMDFGEQPLSDDAGSDAELVIDDNVPAQPEIPDSEIYDPASPSRDTDDEAEGVEPVDIPLPPVKRLVQYSPDSSPPYEISTYPALTETLAVAPTGVALQITRNSSDEEEETAECPNFSIYSAASMDLARATDDLDKPQQVEKDKSHAPEFADVASESEDDGVPSELTKDGGRSEVASPGSPDKSLTEMDDVSGENANESLGLKASVSRDGMTDDSLRETALDGLRGKVSDMEDSRDKPSPKLMTQDSQSKALQSDESDEDALQSANFRDKVVVSDDSQEKIIQTEDSQDKVMPSEDSQDKVIPIEDSQDKILISGEDSEDIIITGQVLEGKVIAGEDLGDKVMAVEDSQDKVMSTEVAQDKVELCEDSQDQQLASEGLQEKVTATGDLEKRVSQSGLFEDSVEEPDNSRDKLVAYEGSQDEQFGPDSRLVSKDLGELYNPEDCKDDFTEDNNSSSAVLERNDSGTPELRGNTLYDEDTPVKLSATQLEGSFSSPLANTEEDGEEFEITNKDLRNINKEKCRDGLDAFKGDESPDISGVDTDKEKIDDGVNNLSGEVFGVEERESLAGGAPSVAIAENTPLPGLEGLETETISETEEAINFDDTISADEVMYHEDGDQSSHKKQRKKKTRKTSEFFNERQNIRKELAPIDYEEGEIVDDVQKKEKKLLEKKDKHEVHKVTSDDFDVVVSKLVIEEDKKKKKKKAVVDKSRQSKERIVLSSSENKDKKKDRGTSKDDDENISWKKPSKSTKDRNYRDPKGKEPSPKGKEVSKKDSENKEKKRKKEKRKDMERYDVRKIVGDKKRKKRDEFGRDLPSRDRSYSRSRSRGRSYERLRNRSRSASRGRARSPIRTRTIWSMSRSRSRSRNRSRNRSRSRSRNKAKQRPRRSRSREKQRARLSRDRSKSRGKHSRSKSRSRSVNRLRLRSRSRTPARPREKKARSREQNVSARRRRATRDRRSWSHTWTPSWSRSRSRSYSSSSYSYSRSRTPSVRHMNRSYSRSFSRSWSRERHERIPIMNKRAENIAKSAKKLTVIVPNTKDDAERLRKKDKKRKDKKVKETIAEKRKKRKEKSPAPSKEVFTSGDNILVSVNFSKSNKAAGNKNLAAAGTSMTVLPTATGKDSAKRKHDGTFEGEIIKRKKEKVSKDKNAKAAAVVAGEKPMSEKKRKKLTKPSPRIAAVMNKKPVAIIDLDQSPFHEQTPSPTDLIVLSDSDEHLDKEQPSVSPSLGEKDRAPTPPISAPQTPDSRSPMMNYLVISTGPKTPPEPQIKFSIAPSKAQMRALSNPLREEEEELLDEEVAMEQQLDEDMEEVVHKGPNTPPEPRGPSTPRSPPISPDAYDPFDPTKSGTPSPVGMEISMDDEEPSPEGTLSEVPQQPAGATVSSPPLLGDPEELPGKTTDVGPLLAASQEPEEAASRSPPAPVLLPKSPPLLGEPVPTTCPEPEPQPAEEKEQQTVVVVSESSSPQPQKPPPVTPVKTQQPQLQPQPQVQLFVAPKQVPLAASTPTVLPLPSFPSLTPSSIITLLTTTPVVRQPFLLSQPARHNGEARLEEEADVDLDSPYSPASSEGDDLFEPPPEPSRPAAPPVRVPGKPLAKLPLPAMPMPRKSQEKFDTLFGVSPLRSGKSANRSGRQAKSFTAKTSKSKLKSSGKKEIAIKMDEDQLQILDELPSSAVEMQVKDKFLKKLNRQERVVEEVKLSLKPHYTKKHITKEEYKDILRRSVPKICHNKTGEINPVKIATLVEAYVKKYRYQKKKGAGGGGGVGAAPKPKLSKTTMWS